jgi:hypothetical protein
MFITAHQGALPPPDQKMFPSTLLPQWQRHQTSVSQGFSALRAPPRVSYLSSQINTAMEKQIPACRNPPSVIALHKSDGRSIAPAAWRCSPRSFAPHPWLRILLRIVHTFPKKCTHYAQNRHKQIKRLKTTSILGEQSDGADPLAHDASDRVNNGGIYGTLAYD